MISNEADDGFSVKKFILRNSGQIAEISILWFILSLPIVTIGFSTLFSYICVKRINDFGSISLRDAFSQTRTHWIHVVLLGLLPVIFFFIGVLYLIEFLATGISIYAILCIFAIYMLLFVLAVLIPTFVGIAYGESPGSALRVGYYITIQDPYSAISIATATIAMFIISTVFTVLLPIGFGGGIASYHVINFNDKF